jgi:hypothetical protein
LQAWQRAVPREVLEGLLATESQCYQAAVLLFFVCYICAYLQAWQRAVPREVLEGLLATESLRRQHGLKGVAGCLVDLLDVPPQLVTAADVVAGNQLFQVIVRGPHGDAGDYLSSFAHSSLRACACTEVRWCFAAPVSEAPVSHRVHTGMILRRRRKDSVLRPPSGCALL